jgi:hypothetical protein
MIDTSDDKLPKRQMQDTRKRCPSCAAFPWLAQQMLAPRTGKTVKLYRC